MPDDSGPEPKAISSELLRAMAETVGVSFTRERAVALTPQAEQHFAQLKSLDAIANPSTEPAAELHLDRSEISSCD